MKSPVVYYLLFCLVYGNGSKKGVRLSSSNQVKLFSAPLAKKLIYCWIVIEKGIYPHVQPITDIVNLGEDITLFIYLKEPNNMYDVTITNCWAFNDENVMNSTNRISIYDIKNTTDVKFWKKVKYFEDNVPVIVSFTDFKVFKFPEDDKVFLTCDITLCYKKCREE